MGLNRAAGNRNLGGAPGGVTNVGGATATDPYAAPQAGGGTWRPTGAFLGQMRASMNRDNPIGTPMGGRNPNANNYGYGTPGGYLSGPAAQAYSAAGLTPDQVAQRQSQWAGQYGGGARGQYMGYLHNQDVDNATEAMRGIGPERLDTATLGTDALTRNGYLVGGNLAAYNQAHGTHYTPYQKISDPNLGQWLASRR